MFGSAVSDELVIEPQLYRWGRELRNGRMSHCPAPVLLVHRILNRNTLKDFLFRSSLPTGEDEALQENPKFWELIEAAKTAPSKT